MIFLNYIWVYIFFYFTPSHPTKIDISVLVHNIHLHTTTIATMSVCSEAISASTDATVSEWRWRWNSWQRQCNQYPGYWCKHWCQCGAWPVSEWRWNSQRWWHQYNQYSGFRYKDWCQYSAWPVSEVTAAPEVPEEPKVVPVEMTKMYARTVYNCARDNVAIRYFKKSGDVFDPIGTCTDFKAQHQGSGEYTFTLHFTKTSESGSDDTVTVYDTITNQFGIYATPEGNRIAEAHIDRQDAVRKAAREAANARDAAEAAANTDRLNAVRKAANARDAAEAAARAADALPRP